MSVSSSDIRVFVDWVESSVFAGEEIMCNIIFRNFAANVNIKRDSTHSQAKTEPAPTEKQDKLLASNLKNFQTRNARSAPPNRGHRTTLSLNLPTNSIPNLNTGQSPTSINKIGCERSPHRRSVSIISIGTQEKGVEQGNTLSSLIERSRGASKSHGRSASLQTIPQKQASFNQRLPSKMLNSPSSPLGLTHFMSTLKSPHPQDGSTEPSYSQRTYTIASGSKNCNPLISPLSNHIEKTRVSSDTKFDKYRNVKISDQLKNYAPPTLSSNSRQFSSPIAIETPNFAGKSYNSKGLYLSSNNSSESRLCEPNSHCTSPIFNGAQANRSATLQTVSSEQQSEILMMGYAQLNGSFTLDSSLINQTPFEEVKRKGILGGQGGGVVGVETNKRESGLLRGFGWANIGDSLGDLLGSNELSSIKEIRDIVSSRSIPLFSTPQSILFVDLKLGPGESSSYKYSFILPHGLPPSHRGRAIKIIYKLIIGIQRPGGGKEQHVKSIEIPFRVLGSVDNNGNLLGHDLMNPYIILQDKARVRTTSGNTKDQGALVKSFKPHDSGLSNFLSYVDGLLSKSRDPPSTDLLSPSEAGTSRRSSQIEESFTAKEAIDMAIFRSNIVTEAQKCPNKYEISRSGKRVAVFMLARPSYRLGETILATIDFADAKIPCYAIHASLESFEKVDSSISLRSEASVFRVTRKTYVSHSESTLFSSRIMFTPTIPTSATPEFVTSGVCLDWRIRVEFVTPKLENGSKSIQVYPDLLREVSVDDRGTIFAPTEILDCDSFQIAVPLRVYGAQSVVEGDFAFVNWISV